MHYILLYNPLSKNGKTNKITNKLAKQLEKQGHTVSNGSLLDIKDVGEYIESLKDDDNIVIIGGDGTIHYLANAISEYEIKQNVYGLKNAGTGNDFIRSLKSKSKLVLINDYIKNIPKVKNDDSPENYFVNSVGIGIDAAVCEMVNSSRKGKSDSNYFKSAFRAFKISKRFELDVTIDGKKMEVPKTWFAVVANGGYFGGGMKLSPKSDRLDDILEVILVKDVPKWLLFFIFPTIYLGWHKIFRKYVKFYEGKHIVFQAKEGQFVQHDGESYYPVQRMEVKR